MIVFSVNLPEPPPLRPSEDKYVINFYVPSPTADLTAPPCLEQVSWVEKGKRRVTLRGDGEKGFYAVLLARRLVKMHRLDEPHYRYRLKAQGMFLISDADVLVLYDPSQNYKAFIAIPIEINIDISREFAKELWEARVKMMKVVEDFGEQAKDIPPPTAPATKGIRLKRYTAVAGPMPAAVFALLHDGQGPAVRFPWAVEASAIMHGWTFDEVVQDLRTLKEQGAPAEGRARDHQAKALGILFYAFTLAGSCNDYVSDVRGRGEQAERFLCPLCYRLGQGDCEDCNKEIQLFARSVQQADWSNDADVEVLAYFVRLYDIIMCTGLATTPSLQKFRGSDIGQDPDDYICHVFTVAAPSVAVTRMLGRETGEPSPLDAFLTEQGALVLEGTNFTTTQPRELPGYYMLKSTLKEMAVAKWAEIALQQRLPGPVKDLCRELTAAPTLERPESLGAFSTFYRFVTGAWLLRDNRNTNAIDFMVLDTSGGSGKETYGVTMQNFVELRNVELRAVYRWSGELDNAAQRMLAVDPPVQMVSRIEPDPSLAHHSGKWREFVRLVEKSGPTEEMLERGGERPMWRPFLEVRLQHINEMTERRFAAIERMVGGGWRVEALPWMFTPHIGIIQIRLYCPKPQAKAVGKAELKKYRRLVP